jgi:hypothetical protein
MTITPHQAERTCLVTFERSEWRSIESAAIHLSLSHREAVQVVLVEGLRHLCDLAARQRRGDQLV